MGTILGDLFKKVGGGLGKVFDGEIIDGVGDVLGGVIDGAGRTVNSALKLVGLGEDEVEPGLGFIYCAVAVLAKMAKADGRVSKKEIGFLNSVLDNWELEEEMKQSLREFANEQKKSVDDIFEFASVAAQFAAKLSPDDEGLDIRVDFYRKLFLMALADGELDDKEIELLRAIPDFLGLKDEAFEFVAHEILGGAEGRTADTTNAALADAYSTLGVSPDATDAEVRKAWKKKMATFHPDKIQGKDLDPEWLELANEKSTEINGAYETIKAARQG